MYFGNFACFGGYISPFVLTVKKKPFSLCIINTETGQEFSRFFSFLSFSLIFLVTNTPCGLKLKGWLAKLLFLLEEEDTGLRF